MNWSWKLGAVAGIGLYLHPTFLIVPAYVWLTTLAAGGGAVAAIASIVAVLAIFGCVVLHELGHALMARHYGIVTRDITLLPIGGLARLERMPREPSQELAIALAGPVVNVVIAASLAVGLLLGGGSPVAAMLEGSLVGTLLSANVALVLFNLLPAFPMDGGRVLRAALAMRMPYLRATRLAATVGQVLAVLMGVVGLFGGNWTLLLIAIFIYFAASGEAQRAELEPFGDELDESDPNADRGANPRHADHWGSPSDRVWPTPHHTWDIRDSRGQWSQGWCEHEARRSSSRIRQNSGLVVA
jgi:Zn-dependent protease